MEAEKQVCTEGTSKGKKKFKSKSKKKTAADEINERNEKCAGLQNIDLTNISSFSDVSISERTLEGLNESGFIKPTDIQKEGIVLALQGHDVLGAAKTGSGKTLAFLVPVLELLWHESWSNADGMGALIISPTRELALQSYEVLRKIGKKHDFSAGLIIGGKDYEDERQRISNTNIVVGTPGRILQHFDETPNFDCFNLKLLVLDEADRILDLGFLSTVNAILDALPMERQTLLYSATQTKSVKDLARLSLKKPKYIDVHESSKYTTPKKLVQNYIHVELYDKINFLFSFIKNHLKSKCIVFLSSCKQVKFIYEVFRKLRPGIPLAALYGKQKQLKRVAIYNRFCSIQHSVLFATDIAARGLDFPSVNWVIQYDCPENPDTYIHRVGRTARFEKGGQALLMLLPSENEMVTKLVARKIPIHELKSNPKKIRSIQGKLQSFCIQDQQIKDWAQKSIVSYVRSVFLQGDKSVFNVTKLPLDQFSTACGLMATPKLQFMKKTTKKIGPENKVISDESVEESLDKIKYKKISRVPIGEDFSDGDDDDGDDENVLVRKSGDFHHDKIEALKPHEIKTAKKRVTKAKIAKAVINKNINVGSRIVFDEDDNVIAESNEPISDDCIENSDGIDIAKAKLYMQDQDSIDYEKEKHRVKVKHKQVKRKGKKDRENIPAVELSMPNEEDMSDDDISEEDGTSCSASKRVKYDETTTEILPKFTSSIQEDEGLALHLLGAN